MARRCKKGGYLGRGGTKGALPAPDPSSYNSAHSYGTVVAGTKGQQWNAVFGNGQTNGMGQSNSLITQQGNPTVRPPQKGGKTKRKRGGIFGAVIDQAIVPFGLLALQNAYRRRDTRGSKKYHKKRFTKRRFTKKRSFRK